MDNPNVTILLICDEIIRHIDNKWSMIGVFDRIFSKNFPAMHPKFGIFNQWSGGVGKHKIQIQILDPSNGNIIVQTPEREVEFPNADHKHNDVLNCINTKFDHPGDYWVHSLLNGESVRREKLVLVLANKP